MDEKDLLKDEKDLLKQYQDLIKVQAQAIEALKIAVESKSDSNLSRDDDSPAFGGSIKENDRAVLSKEESILSKINTNGITAGDLIAYIVKRGRKAIEEALPVYTPFEEAPR